MAEKIQNEIYYSMPAEKKIRIFFKINSKVHKIAVDKIKSKYPRIDVAHFYKKLYEHINLERKFYDNLFNYFFNKELENEKTGK